MLGGHNSTMVVAEGGRPVCGEASPHWGLAAVEAPPPKEPPRTGEMLRLREGPAAELPERSRRRRFAGRSVLRVGGGVASDMGGRSGPPQRGSIGSLFKKDMTRRSGRNEDCDRELISVQNGNKDEDEERSRAAMG